MVKEFIFPDVGEGISEGKLVKWSVKPGDKVEEDQIIGEIETDKAIVEMPSPYEGIIKELKVPEGGTIHVGEVLVVYEGDGEVELEKPVEKKARESVGIVGDVSTKASGVLPAGLQGRTSSAPSDHIKAAPAARKLAKELKVELSTIKGSGPAGAITVKDVKAASPEEKEPEKKTAAEAPEEEKTEKKIRVVRKYDMYGYVKRVPLSMIRKTIAKTMVKSWKEIPHVTHMDEADVTELVEVRKTEKEIAAEQGIHLTYLPFIMKAMMGALKKYPDFNASYDEENEELVIKEYYNIGFAVDTEAGLMVPVLKRSEQKTLMTLAKEMQDLAEAARSRKINIMDMQGGSITITNIGSLGGLYATPIIRPPEVAILGLGKIYDKIVPGKDGKPEVRKVMPISLSFDHRVLDGANAARFVSEIIRHLADPDILLV
ncbi:TPA: 2-oxo acid dehydrogenase subunit E2 [archaeon]|uniref:2-oxo acid dehydrogenase subunit E2 n=1 Tax=Candidatus Undinarchaeum marinum TaxID=2756141 RepID=A0A832UM40_9ARCH|nr:2-oxo acid dehydrogenase subunit E2 [Candidatus Undinarchaeum marinum]